MAKIYGNIGSILFLLVLSPFQLSFCSPLAQKEQEVILDPDDLTQETTPGPETYADWTDWETWVPPADVVKAFPYYKMGYDNDGLSSKF